MNRKNSLAGRAVLALVLMVGFYLLAVAIAAGLLYIPVAEVFYLHHLTPKLDLICIIAGIAILWSVLPRIDKFIAPGPLLTPAQHPRLFEEIQSVATAVGQEMPAEVYLVPDVNAWVMQRGGVMGFGSRRVMGLGLPLMRTLTRSEFRAVLAHEFGHYHGGDTKLGPWIYKTRGAIGRTLASLGNGSWLQKPFLWYGKMFLRITHAISRRQEFVADELAARTVGATPLASGLRAVHGAGMTFAAFWHNECAPVLHAGFHPPLAEGFHRFLQARPVAEAIHKSIEEELKSGKADPYDTHPPLKERIAALEALGVAEVRPDATPALSLLNDVPAVEKLLLQSMAGAEMAGKLNPIEWPNVCAQVYLPLWKKLVEVNAKALNEVPLESLPGLATDRKSLGKKFVFVSGEHPEEQNAEGLAGAVIGAALTLALLGKGGKLQTAPGENVSVIVGSLTFEPFGILEALASGKTKAEQWQQQIVQAGIATANLADTSGEIPAETITREVTANDDSRYMPKG